MKGTTEKIVRKMKKYKYVLLILLLGIVLLIWPGGTHQKEEKESVPPETEKHENYAGITEQKLSLMLSEIAGAGRVRVMLTLNRGPKTEFQTDSQTEKNGDRNSEDRKTVILSHGSAYDEAAVSAVQYPVFQGALIVCDGAENPAVRLNIVQAVSAVTGLGSDRITVVKMK